MARVHGRWRGVADRSLAAILVQLADRVADFGGARRRRRRPCSRSRSAHVGLFACCTQNVTSSFRPMHSPGPAHIVRQAGTAQSMKRARAARHRRSPTLNVRQRPGRTASSTRASVMHDGADVVLDHVVVVAADADALARRRRRLVAAIAVAAALAVALGPDAIGGWFGADLARWEARRRGVAPGSRGAAACRRRCRLRIRGRRRRNRTWCSSQRGTARAESLRAAGCTARPGRSRRCGRTGRRCRRGRRRDARSGSSRDRTPRSTRRRSERSAAPSPFAVDQVAGGTPRRTGSPPCSAFVNRSRTYSRRRTAPFLSRADRNAAGTRDLVDRSTTGHAQARLRRSPARAPAQRIARVARARVVDGAAGKRRAHAARKRSLRNRCDRPAADCWPRSSGRSRDRRTAGRSRRRARSARRSALAAAFAADPCHRRRAASSRRPLRRPRAASRRHRNR